MHHVNGSYQCTISIELGWGGGFKREFLPAGGSGIAETAGRPSGWEGGIFGQWGFTHLLRYIGLESLCEAAISLFISAKACSRLWTRSDSVGAGPDISLSDMVAEW